MSGVLGRGEADFAAAEDAVTHTDDTRVRRPAGHECGVCRARFCARALRWG